MRLGEFWETVDAYNREKEAERKHAGELARGVAIRLFNIQVAKNSRITDPVKFWPMPWDEIPHDAELERLESLTDEEKTREAQKFLDRIKLKNG
jgi:hypothetical protein